MPELYIKTVRPRYLEAYRNGLLQRKISVGKKLLEECVLCPRQCKTNRYEEPGKICETGVPARVSSYFAHFGEEACLTGFRGSGTIFFSSCNLRCVFCQNWDISHTANGKEVSPEELARMMIHLQEMGCHNINFVTPSHVVIPILEALPPAIESGLQIPLVYNTSGYDSLTTLELLEGIIDIYMPDFKFLSVKSSKNYLKAKDYPAIIKRNMKIMYEQVGNLIVNAQGIAVSGLLIRHLVMPDHNDDSSNILSFIANEISVDCAVNLMFQYHPVAAVNSEKLWEVNRRLTTTERSTALKFFSKAGLKQYDWL